MLQTKQLRPQNGHKSNKVTNSERKEGSQPSIPASTIPALPHSRVLIQIQHERNPMHLNQTNAAGATEKRT
jgi:hypothetical protein